MLIVTSDPVARYLSQRATRARVGSRLRPMTSMEIIDAALRIYQQLGLSFLRLSVVPALLCLSSIAFVLEYVIPGLFYSQDSGNFLVHVGNVLLAMALAVFVGGPLFLAGLSYTSCLVVGMVSDYTVGNAVDAAAAREAAIKAMPRLFRVTMRELMIAFVWILPGTAITLYGIYLTSHTDQRSPVAGIAAMMGLLAIGAGGIVSLTVLANDAVAPPVAVLENLGASQAGKRARSLMKRAPMHGNGSSAVYGLYATIAFIGFAMWIGLSFSLSLLHVDDLLKHTLFGLPFGVVLRTALALVPSFFALWTIIPLWAIAVTLIYFDRRIRLEGFDIEILARNLARSSRKSRFEL